MSLQKTMIERYPTDNSNELDLQNTMFKALLITFLFLGLLLPSSKQYFLKLINSDKDLAYYIISTVVFYLIVLYVIRR